MKKFIFVLSLLLFPILVLCQVVDDPEVPISDVFNDIVELIRNWKGLGALAISASILSVIVQGFKTKLIGNPLDALRPGIKRLLIVLLGQVQAIILAIAGGMSWWESILAGLITSGGAMAIYECLKPIFKKADK